MKPERRWAFYQEKEGAFIWDFVMETDSDYAAQLIREYLKSGWMVTVDKRQLPSLKLEPEIISKMNTTKTKIEVFHGDSKSKCNIAYLVPSDEVIKEPETIITIEDTELD